MLQHSDSFKKERQHNRQQRRKSKQQTEKKFNRSLLSHAAIAEKKERRKKEIEENAIVEDDVMSLPNAGASSKAPSPRMDAQPSPSKSSKNKSKKTPKTPKKSKKSVQFAQAGKASKKSGAGGDSGTSHKRSKSQTDKKSSRKLPSSKPVSARGAGPQKRFAKENKNDKKRPKTSRGSASATGRSGKKSKRRNSIDKSVNGDGANGNDGGGAGGDGMEDDVFEVEADPMEDLRDATDGEVLKLLFKKLSHTSIFYYLLGNVGIALQKNKVNITNWLLIPPTNARDANAKKREAIADLQDLIEQRKEYLKTNIMANDSNISEQGMEKVYNNDHLLLTYQKNLKELNDTRDKASIMDNEVRRRIRYEVNDRKLLHALRYLLLKYCKLNKDKLRSFLRDKRKLATAVEVAKPEERTEWEVTSEIAAKEAINYEPSEILNALPKREKIRIYTFLRDKFAGNDNSVYGESIRHALGPAPLNPNPTVARYPQSRLYFDSRFDVEHKAWEDFDVVDDGSGKNKDGDGDGDASNENKDGVAAETPAEDDEKALTLEEANKASTNSQGNRKKNKIKWKQRRAKERNDLYERPHVRRDDAIEYWNSQVAPFNPRAPSYVNHALRLDKDISSITNFQVIIDILIRYNHIAHKHLTMLGEPQQMPQAFVSMERMRLWETIREIEKYRTSKLEAEMKEKYEEKIKRMMTNIELLAREINQSRSTMERILHGVKGKKSRFGSIKKEFRALSEQIEAQDTKSDQYLNNLRFEDRFTPAAQANAKFMKLLKENKALSDQIKNIRDEYETLMQNTDGRRLEAEMAEMKEQIPIIKKHENIIESLKKVKKVYSFTWECLSQFLNSFLTHLDHVSKREARKHEQMRKLKESEADENKMHESQEMMTTSHALVPRRNIGIMSSIDEEKKPGFGRQSTTKLKSSLDIPLSGLDSVTHLRKKSQSMSLASLLQVTKGNMGHFSEDQDDDEVAAAQNAMGISMKSSTVGKKSKAMGLDLMSHITEESKTETEMEMNISGGGGGGGDTPMSTSGAGAGATTHDRSRKSDEFEKKSGDDENENEDDSKEKDDSLENKRRDSKGASGGAGDDENENEDDNEEEDEEHASEYKGINYKSKIIEKFKKFMDIDWIDQDLQEKVEEINEEKEKKRAEDNALGLGFGVGNDLGAFIRTHTRRVNAANIADHDSDSDEQIDKAQKEADSKYAQLYKEYYTNYVIDKESFDKTKEKYDKLFEWETGLSLQEIADKQDEMMKGKLTGVEKTPSGAAGVKSDKDLIGHIGVDSDFSDEEDADPVTPLDTLGASNNNNENAAMERAIEDFAIEDMAQEDNDKDFIDTFDPSFDIDAYINERLYDENQSMSDSGKSLSDEFGIDGKVKEKSFLPYAHDPDEPEFYPKIDFDAAFRNDGIKFQGVVSGALWKEHPIIKEAFERETRELEMWGPISNRKSHHFGGSSRDSIFSDISPVTSPRHAPSNSRKSRHGASYSADSGQLDALGGSGSSFKMQKTDSTSSIKSDHGGLGVVDPTGGHISRRHSPRISHHSRKSGKRDSGNSVSQSISRYGDIGGAAGGGSGGAADFVGYGDEDDDDDDEEPSVSTSKRVGFTVEDMANEDDLFVTNADGTLGIAGAPDGRRTGTHTGTHTPGRSRRSHKRDGGHRSGHHTPGKSKSRHKHKKDKKEHHHSKRKSRSKHGSRHHSRHASKDITPEELLAATGGDDIGADGGDTLGHENDDDHHNKKKKHKKRKHKSKKDKSSKKKHGKNDDNKQGQNADTTDADASETDHGNHNETEDDDDDEYEVLENPLKSKWSGSQSSLTQESNSQLIVQSSKQQSSQKPPRSPKTVTPYSATRNTVTAKITDKLFGNNKAKAPANIQTDTGARRKGKNKGDNDNDNNTNKNKNENVDKGYVKGSDVNENGFEEIHDSDIQDDEDDALDESATDIETDRDEDNGGKTPSFARGQGQEQRGGARGGAQSGNNRQGGHGIVGPGNDTETEFESDIGGNTPATRRSVNTGTTPIVEDLNVENYGGSFSLMTGNAQPQQQARGGQSGMDYIPENEMEDESDWDNNNNNNNNQSSANIHAQQSFSAIGNYNRMGSNVPGSEYFDRNNSNIFNRNDQRDSTINATHVSRPSTFDPNAMGAIHEDSFNQGSSFRREDSYAQHHRMQQRQPQNDHDDDDYDSGHDDDNNDHFTRANSSNMNMQGSMTGVGAFGGSGSGMISNPSSKQLKNRVPTRQTSTGSSSNQLQQGRRNGQDSTSQIQNTHGGGSTSYIMNKQGSDYSSPGTKGSTSMIYKQPQQAYQPSFSKQNTGGTGGMSGSFMGGSGNLSGNLGGSGVVGGRNRGNSDLDSFNGHGSGMVGSNINKQASNSMFGREMSGGSGMIRQESNISDDGAFGRQGTGLSDNGNGQGFDSPQSNNNSQIPSFAPRNMGHSTSQLGHMGGSGNLGNNNDRPVSASQHGGDANRPPSTSMHGGGRHQFGGNDIVEPDEDDDDDVDHDDDEDESDHFSD